MGRAPTAVEAAADRVLHREGVDGRDQRRRTASSAISLAGTPVAGVLVWAPCSGDMRMTVSLFSYARQGHGGLPHRRRHRRRPAAARRRLPRRTARARPPLPQDRRMTARRPTPPRSIARWDATVERAQAAADGVPRDHRPGAGRPDRPRDGHRRPRGRGRARRARARGDRLRRARGQGDQELRRHRVPLRPPAGQALGRRHRRRTPSARSTYVAEPIGVVLALLPITNPTSTALFKSIVAAKTRNAIIFRPSARAARCATRAIEILQRAGEAEGLPPQRAAGHPRRDARGVAVPLPPRRRRPDLDDRRPEGRRGGQRGRQAVHLRRPGQRARSTCTRAPTCRWPSSTC